ncbi:hypothetical protein SAMN05880501_101568 [Ureibacillus xyleni]|uniref:Uncharacterized protein n=1 Tax=Ureibacillus xyleni TaxID=614648 RepID=A0A285RFL3_9BACL|nr:hypothetical protein [Ureibacillus xyleni]SOB92905.1 hypothetical protein SAMN05880501_101568 [Ureibacillus xyleni]
MTSTSFNPIQSQQIALQSNQPLTLKQGQVFHGTVKKLYPDQMAEIQVGGHKLFAKLETPLKAGDSHFFQVTNMNPQAQLKVVTGPMQNSQTTQQLLQLLESMNLPKSSEMQKILSYFIKNQLPIAKETLVQTESFLKNIPDNAMKQDALAIVQRMVETKMPFTKEIFDGLLNGAKTSGFTEELLNFSKLLNEDSSVLPQVKSNIFSSLQTIAKPFESETSGMILAKALQTIMNQNAESQSRVDSLDLLKEANILPQNAKVNNWFSQAFQQVKTNKSTGNDLGKLISTAKVEDIPKILQQLRTFINEGQNQGDELPTNIRPNSSIVHDISKILQQLKSFDSNEKQQMTQLINEFEKAPKNDSSLQQFAKQLQAQLGNDNTIQKSIANEIVQAIANGTQQNLPRLLDNLKTWLHEQPLTANQKEQIHQLINRFEVLPKTPQTIEIFAKQLHEQLIKAFSESLNTFELNEQGYSKKDNLLSLLKPESIINANTTFSNLAKTATESKQPFIQQMVVQVDDEIRASIEGKSMEYAVKTILKSLGLSYEASLNTKPENIQDHIHSLKPQILSLMQDATTSATVREAAESILSRLNGMQLHSGENGHQHQIVMQIPLHFFGKNTDATVQWNGRMGKNGKIDSNFVRILFYLNMEALEETMVDMQVQNRIVTINVYNENNSLENLAIQLRESLKKGLLEKNYHLSGLTFKTFEKTVPQKAENLNKVKGNQKSQSGVDIRI